MQRTPTCENCQRNYELRDFRPTGNRIPLLLPCGHTFCEGCIFKATKNKQNFTCFKCDKEVQFEEKGEAGVKTLLPNIYLLGLLLFNRRIATDRITGGSVRTFNGIGNVIYKNTPRAADKSESSAPSTASNSTDKDKLCDECNLVKATCQCKSCDDSNLCEACFQQVHKASKQLMKHTPLPLDFTNAHHLTCNTHGRKIEFYDNDTSAAVCAICIISEKCRGHDIVLLSEVNIETDKLDTKVKEAEETLFWLQKSSAILTKALPEEYMEANQLFAVIQSRFNNLHTFLLKRQLEIMAEASEKIVANGSSQNMINDLSQKINSLSSLLSDVKMIMEDSNVVKLKSDELKNKLDEFIDVPCIVRRTQLSENDKIFLCIKDENIDQLRSIGDVHASSVDRFYFQPSKDVADEVKEQIKSCSDISEFDQGEIEANEIILEEEFDVKLRKFSLSSGYNELVCVTDVTDPTDFKVQRLADKDRLQVLMTDLNKYCRYTNSADSLVHHVEEGQLVCAQFLSDNNWYRARVTDKWPEARPDVVPTWSNGLAVEVFYVDYGNKERLPLTRLRQLPKQFLQIPEMAVSCTLTDIVPPSLSTEWPDRSKKAFASLTGDRPMLMNIRKRVGCILHVDLRKPDDDEPTRDDDRPVSVRDALVFLEVAAFLSPASLPNSNMHQPVRKYKPHESFIEGEFVDMMVTHIEDPEAVFVQKLNSEIHEEQSRLGLVYNSRNKKGWLIDYPHRNLVCAARFSADNLWYRAKVLNVYHDDTVEVEYVDYGNHECIPFSDLRRIPDMYLEMPQQCIKVKLHGLTLPDSVETWADEAIEFLHKFFLGKPLVTVFKSLTDDEDPSVELYDTSTSADINMNEFMTKFVNKSNMTSTDTVSEELERMIASIESVDNQVIEQEEKKEVIDFPKYLSPVMPRSKRFSATGVYVDDNAGIYLHVMDENDSCLTDIMQQLNCNIISGNLTSSENLYVNQAVVAKFSQDNLWYRVEIVEIINDKKVVARYIDFGNSEESDISDICSEPKFLEIPAQCISINLSDVEPVGSEWSVECITLVRECIVSEVVGIVVNDSQSQDTLSGLIYIDEQTTLNETLVRKKLAKENSA